MDKKQQKATSDKSVVQEIALRGTESRQRDKKKENMLNAMESNLGHISDSCRAAGIGRQTHYLWMGKDKNYAERIYNLGERQIDTVESKLFTLIEKGNVIATIFYLKTKGSARGYQESTTITGVNGTPLIPAPIYPPEITVKILRNGTPPTETDTDTDEHYTPGNTTIRRTGGNI